MDGGNFTELDQLERDLDAIDAARARDSFLHYYQRMTGFTPPPHIRVMAHVGQKFEDDVIDRLMVFAPPRHAKRLADDTPMLTANRGWTTHGNLKAGDRVWHPNGEPVTIEAVSQPGQSDLLVTFSNGEEIQCDGDHLWTVWDRNHSSRDRYRGFKTFETITTTEMLERGTLLSGEAGQRGCRYRFHLPDTLGISGKHYETRMGPYTLGAWLGDGSTTAARLTSHKDDIDAIVSGFEAEGYEQNNRYTHRTTGVPTAVFSCGKRGGGHKSKLRKHLESQGVWNNKHIPDKWLTASRSQRLQLLAGLMDTDGHCEAKSGRCRIVTTVPALARGIHDLCTTLGFRPYITTATPDGSTDSYGITSRATVFTVGFQPHEPIPCRLERKRPQRFCKRRAVTIKSIKKVAAKSCRCIKVSAADGLYLAGRKLVPTHNTTMFSTLLPSWIMGRNPTTKQMSVVHTQRFAAKVGRNVRNMLLRPEWPFPDVQLSEDTTAKEQWTTNAGGEYNAFGAIGGNQHGNPAEILFMDDLVKGRKIAMSAHMRDEVWETYKTDLLSRLEGRSKQVMVFTRWHEDDPAGRILPENFDGQTGWYEDRETGERWFVLSLPAIAEHENDPLKRKRGEWLWPERFGEKKLGGMKRRGGWVWSALYQQRPAPEDGLMFTKEHIQYYDPAHIDMTRMQVYMSSDYAVTAEAGAVDPDYTVHLVWCVDEEYNIYLLDGWRGRTTSDVWIREFIRLARKWKPLRAGEEAGQIIKGVGPFLRSMMLQERVHVNRVQLTSSVSKEQRAQALLGMASMGKMWLPHRAKCSEAMILLLDAFEKELLQFPAGRHDDIVDAATLFARMLDRIIAGKSKTSKSGPIGNAQDGLTLDDLFAQHDREEARRLKDEDW